LKTAIVILNFNGREHLETFLPSVVDNTSHTAKIVVADNASTDDSVIFLKSQFPQISVIELEENYGFAGGYNRALQKVDAQYYVLLNSDVEVPKGWLEPLIERMDKREEITACQPKIISYSDKDCFEYAGASGGFIDKNGFPFCRGRIFDHIEKDIGQHDDEREVFWASGACLAIRAEAFHQIDGFDETLFAHMEEIDLCWRLKNQGHSVFCFPDSEVFHLGGGTLASTSAQKTYLNFRNNLAIIIRNDYRGSLLKKLVKRMTFDGAAAMYMLVTSGPKHFVSVLRAHLYFYTHLNRLLKERKLLKAQASNKNKTGFYRGSIVQDYYKDRKKVFGALAGNLFVRQNRKV